MLATPLFALLALLVKPHSPGPVIFRQRRYGLDGREIIVYKFRTMNVTEDGPHVPQASKTDSRVTPSAAFCAAYRWMNCRNWSTCCRAG